MTPSIDTLPAAPIIGKYYMVPTVHYNCCGYVSDWPVFGPRHDDAEIIGFPWPHYHHDSRFMTARQFRAVVAYGGLWRPDYVNIAALPLHRLKNGANQGPDHYEVTVPHPKPIYKKLLCKRDMHMFPVPGVDVAEDSFVTKMRKHYKDDCLRVTENGTFCPHRGVRLDTLKPVDGVITCPLHGLRFYAATGKSL